MNKVKFNEYVGITKAAILETVTTVPTSVGELADSVQRTFPELSARDALSVAYEAARQLINSGQIDKA